LLSGNAVSISIATTVDTPENKSSGKVTGAFFANDNYSTNSRVLELNKKLNGFKDSLLLKGFGLQKGVHSFFISFPGGVTKAYSCFATTALKDNVVANLTERVTYNIKEADYQQFFNDLSKAITKGDSARVVGQLPKNFQGLLCFDFVSSAELGNDDGTFESMITKYQFNNPDNVTDFNSFFKFIGGKTTAVQSYLATDWQYLPAAFKPDVTQLKKDMFTVPGTYTQVTNIKDFSSQLSMAYYDEGKTYHRILIFVNH
jgi:hypothetical protein